MEKARKRLILELRKNIAIVKEKVSGGDVKAFVEMDAQFHEIIARLSGSNRLLELAQTLRRHMLRYRVQSIYMADNVLRAMDGHERILKAIESWDLDGVREAIRYHMECTTEDVLRYAFKEPSGTHRHP